MKQLSGKTTEMIMRTALALVAAAVLLSDARAAQAAVAAQTRIAIQARVLPYAHITVLQQPASFVVTEGDIARGYVETAAPVTAEVRSNTPGGCLIVLESSGAPVRQIVVGVMGRSVAASPSGGLIALDVRGRQQVAFTFRFLLAPDAQPGSYAWPVQLQAQSL